MSPSLFKTVSMFNIVNEPLPCLGNLAVSLCVIRGLMSNGKIPEKLKQIRQRTRLTQGQIVRHVKAKNRASISAYERGERQPSTPVLLAYARLAGVPLENLVEDELDLLLGRGIPYVVVKPTHIKGGTTHSSIRCLQLWKRV